MDNYPTADNPWPDKEHPYQDGDNDGACLPPVPEPKKDDL